MKATENLTDLRYTYEGWKALGRQVKRGERRGADGKFGFSQTKGAGSGSRGPRTCGGCGCRINYGRFCGKCEFGR